MNASRTHPVPDQPQTICGWIAGLLLALSRLRARRKAPHRKGA